jgi:DNA polymerase-3 subunit delta
VTPDEVIANASRGEILPVYLLLGDERFMAERALAAITHAVSGGAVGGFNTEKMTASETTADSVIAAARTVPMMAPLRLVIVRGVDRWEKKGSDDLDQLADYVTQAIDTSVVVLVASKLNGSRRLVRDAKKLGYIVRCDPLKRGQLPRWIADRARALGHPIEHYVADGLAEIAGPELATIDDALERLSLFVGERAPITEKAVACVVTRVRLDTVWSLLDALSQRRLDVAMAALGDAYDGGDGGFPLLGTIGWRVRQLVKLDGALRAGANRGEAAKIAGVPPFKVADLERVVRKLPGGTLGRWLGLLAEADLAMKGSPRRNDRVLETMVCAMCR